MTRKRMLERERFVNFMLIYHRDQRASALALGCKSKTAADTLSQKYMKDPWVVAEIARREAEALKASQLEANDAMKSMAYEVKFNPKKLVDENGRRKELHELDDATASALRVEIDPDGGIRYRSPDKNAAREQAMKHFGLYERDNKQKPFYMPPEIVIVPVEPRRLERKDDGNRS